MDHAGAAAPPPGRFANLPMGVVVLIAMVAGALCVEAGALAIVIIAAAAFLALAVQRPLFAVMAAYAGILLDSRGMTSVTVAGLPLTLSKVLVAAALVAHVGNRLVLRQRMFEWTPLSSGIAAILGSMALSLASVTNLRLAYIDSAGVIMLALLLHLVFTVVDEDNIAVVVRWMSLVTVAVFAEVLVGANQHGNYAGAHEAWQTREAGAFTDPNAWATCILVTSTFLLGALSRDKHAFSGPLITALLVVSPAALLQSMSRAGLLGLVIASPFLIYALWPRRPLVLVALVPLVLATPLVVNVDAVFLRYSTLVNPELEAGIGGHSLSEREALINAAVAVIKANPVFGVGIGNFRVAAEEITSGEVWKIAHNSYLTVAAEQGIPGLIAHAWLALLALRAAARGAMYAPDGVLMGVGRGYLASTIAFGAMAATLNLVSFAIAWYVFAVGMVATRAAERARAEEIEHQRPQRAPRTRAPALTAAARA